MVVRHPFKPTLIINSADYPTVDETSRIVGAYAMEHGIAHCIGGGYNLHQTLIGQIIIPGKTACVECFRLELEDINVIDTSNIKRLDNPFVKKLLLLLGLVVSATAMAGVAEVRIGGDLTNRATFKDTDNSTWRIKKDALIERI